MLYRNKFELEVCLKMSPLKLDVAQPPKMKLYINPGSIRFKDN